MNRVSQRSLIAAISLIGCCLPASAEDVVRIAMATAAGEVSIELYADRAPATVANFLRYVDGEYLDGATFYRTVSYENDNGSPKIEVIQGGLGSNSDPLFDPIAHEDTETTGLTHSDGMISMARGALGTARSEFFIVIGDQPGLDKGAARNADGAGFAAFGKVTAGMEVVRQIHRAPSDAPSDSPYLQGQVIEQPIVIHSVRRKP